MKKILFCFILILSLNQVFAENDKLIKISWMERKSYSRGGYTNFTSVMDLPENYVLYKIKYHIKGTGGFSFNFFIYSESNKKFYRSDTLNYSFSKIPIPGFDYLDTYNVKDKIEDSLNGIYYNDKSRIDYFEIKRIAERNYKYFITLDYEECGTHLLYEDDDGRLVSDSTFGRNYEEIYNDYLAELFSVDRSDMFYMNMNLTAPYSNDKFYIDIINLNNCNEKLQMHSDNQIIDIIPSALDDRNELYLSGSSGARVYSNKNEDSFLFVNDYTRLVTIIERDNKWIEVNDKYVMWIKIQFSDKSVGWVYSNYLSIF